MTPGKVLPRSHHPYRTDHFTGWPMRPATWAVTVTPAPGWWNGRHSRLKSGGRKACGFDSRPGHHPLPADLGLVAPGLGRAAAIASAPTPRSTGYRAVRWSRRAVVAGGSGGSPYRAAQTLRPSPDSRVARMPGARCADRVSSGRIRSEEHTSELQSQSNHVCRLL